MLLNKQRRRALQAILIPRPAHWPRAAPSQPPATATTADAERGEVQAQVTVEAAPPPLEQPARARRRSGDRRPEMTAQERALVAQAFRARYVLSERRVLAHVRRRHRVQLLDELARLATVARDLEAQIDAATHHVLTVERVAMQLERVGALMQDASAVEDAAQPVVVVAVRSDPEEADARGAD